MPRQVAEASTLESGFIRGSVFQEFLMWWERAHAAADVQAALAGLRGQDGQALVLSSGRAVGLRPEAWYPAAAVHHVVDHLIARFEPAQRDEIALRAGEAVMTASLRGPHGAVFQLMQTPDAYPEYVQRMWDLHYDSGRIWIEPRGPGEHLFRRVEWRAHHRFICQVTMATTVPIYRGLGCRSVEFERLACVSDGADACENLVRWS